MAKGIDIGTMNLVVAKQESDGIVTQRIRDAFIDVPKNALKMLKLGGASYIDTGDELLIIGDDALQFGAVFGREVRRPLSRGLISPDELKSAEVLGWIIKELIGEPAEPDETLVFGVPADPVDSDMDTVYHRGVFARMLRKMGYNAIASNEAMAIIYSEAQDSGFSGLAFSFGSGMTNVALSLQAIECFAFSVARGGDWIDQGSARSTGATASKMCTLKEQGIDLLEDYEDRHRQAICFYYEQLIDYALKNAQRSLLMSKGLMFTEPLNVYISGGSSKPTNFKELFEKKLRKMRLPFEIGEVLQPEDPLQSVAKGLLVQALQEDQ